jgi:broad specificity phosphatase PhoE
MNLRRSVERLSVGRPTLRGVAVIVVRHACAGDKTKWPGPDDERPLDEVGRQQALALADLLATSPASSASSIRRIVSSPALRCRQSVEPLARKLGLTIELHEALRRDASARDLEDLLAALRTDDADDADDADEPGDVVLCTHGETMRLLLAGLRHAGVPIVSPRSAADDEALLAKGSAWRFTHAPDGTIVAVEHLVPAELPHCETHTRG